MAAFERSRWRRLCVETLLMASAVSAISLHDFQALNAAGASLPCRIVYSQHIEGCTYSDFASPSQDCSLACVHGVDMIQAELQFFCNRVRADWTSIMGQTLLGNLPGVLCPRKPSAQDTRPTPAGAATSTYSTSSQLATTTLQPFTSNSTSPSPLRPGQPANAATPTSAPLQTTLATGASPSSTAYPGGGSPFDPMARSGSAHLILDVFVGTLPILALVIQRLL